MAFFLLYMYCDVQIVFCTLKNNGQCTSYTVPSVTPPIRYISRCLRMLCVLIISEVNHRYYVLPVRFAIIFIYSKMFVAKYKYSSN